MVANHRFGDVQAPVYGLRETSIFFQPAQLYYITGLGRNADVLDTIDRYLEEWKADRSSVYYDILRRYAQQPGAGPRVPPAICRLRKRSRVCALMRPPGWVMGVPHEGPTRTAPGRRGGHQP
mgnify:CR=1 FL=1